MRAGKAAPSRKFPRVQRAQPEWFRRRSAPATPRQRTAESSEPPPAPRHRVPPHAAPERPRGQNAQPAEAAHFRSTAAASLSCLAPRSSAPASSQRLARISQPPSSFYRTSFAAGHFFTAYRTSGRNRDCSLVGGSFSGRTHRPLRVTPCHICAIHWFAVLWASSNSACPSTLTSRIFWKADTCASVDQFNRWFMKFAPKAYRDTRKKTIESVEQGLARTKDLTTITPDRNQSLSR